MRICILGERKSVLPFKALGVETFNISSESDLTAALKAIEKKDCAILFVTEDVVRRYEDKIEPLYNQTLPAVLVVPGLAAVYEKGQEGLKKILERALGNTQIEI